MVFIRLLTVYLHSNTNFSLCLLYIPNLFHYCCWSLSGHFPGAIYYKPNISLPSGSDSIQIKFEFHPCHHATPYIHPRFTFHLTAQLLIIRHPSGAPRSSPHLYYPEQRVLPWSYCKFIQAIFKDGQWKDAEGEVALYKLMVTNWQVLSSEQLPSTSTALLTKLSRLNLPQLALVQMPLLLLMRQEHELQSFRSSGKLSVQCQIGRLKVNFFYSASRSQWEQLKKLTCALVLQEWNRDNKTFLPSQISW